MFRAVFRAGDPDGFVFPNAKIARTFCDENSSGATESSVYFMCRGGTETLVWSRSQGGKWTEAAPGYELRKAMDRYLVSACSSPESALLDQCRRVLNGEPQSLPSFRTIGFFPSLEEAKRNAEEDCLETKWAHYEITEFGAPLLIAIVESDFRIREWLEHA